MARSEIVRRIARDLNVPDARASAIADAVIRAVEDALCEHGRLEIRDFGVFRIQERKPRMGRNPRTLEPYPIPARRVVTFRMAKEMRRLGMPADAADPQGARDAAASTTSPAIEAGKPDE